MTSGLPGECVGVIRMLPCFKNMAPIRKLLKSMNSPTRACSHRYGGWVKEVRRVLVWSNMIGRYSRYNSVWWHMFCEMVASTFGMMENIFSGTMVGV